MLSIVYTGKKSINIRFFKKINRSNVLLTKRIDIKYLEYLNILLNKNFDKIKYLLNDNNSLFVELFIKMILFTIDGYMAIKKAKMDIKLNKIELTFIFKNLINNKYFIK